MEGRDYTLDATSSTPRQYWSGGEGKREKKNVWVIFFWGGLGVGWEIAAYLRSSKRGTNVIRALSVIVGKRVFFTVCCYLFHISTTTTYVSLVLVH